MTKKANVLIVEDDQWLAEQYVRILSAAGYTAEYVVDTLAAIEAIDEHLPDAIILDVFLTGPNAFTLLHELRSHVDLASIPVILCTNAADALASKEVATYGVSRVLDKSIMQPEDLIAALRKVLS